MVGKTLNPVAYTELIELEASGAEGLIRDLISDFNVSSKELMSAIESSTVVNDWNLLERSAHSLKSSAALLGLENLSRVSFQIEECARLKKASPQEIEQLKALYSDAMVALSAFASQREAKASWKLE